MAQIAHRACQWLGVAVETICTDLSSRALRRSRTNLGTLPCCLPTVFGPPLADLLVGIDDVGDLRIGIGEELVDVFAAAAADADDGHVQQIAGLLGAVSFRRSGQGPAAGKAAAAAAARSESSRNFRRVS